MSKFVHLHVHSHYSLLNALPKIKELVNAAKFHEMDSLAITDNGNLHGAIEFYKKCKAAEIKPIIGVDFYLASRTLHDKQPGIDKERTRLVLLAKNEKGYKNLIKLSTTGYVEGFYYKPRIDKETLEKHASDLICISPSFSGDIAKAIKNEDKKRALEEIEYYKKLFGDDFYIEITHHPEMLSHEKVMEQLIALARETDTPIVAAQDTYYIEPDDHEARETLISVGTGRMSGGGFADEGQEDFSFISQDRAIELFVNEPDALENTIKIAEKCNLELELGTWTFPDMKIPEGKNYDEVLREDAYAGIKIRGLTETPEMRKRIDYELDIIKTKGYSSYFLIVADLMKYAKEHDIESTTRGSAAGSMVSYLTYITTVDPMEYKLPFERFLNPERPSAPDIDIDIADDKRDAMIQYAREKYGIDKVAQIGTFGTMMARGAVKDVARALGYPYSDGDRISKLIPMGSQGFPMTIDKAIEMEPELQKMYKGEAEVKEIIDMAKKMEGCARHISVHAAGVVISPTPLTDFTPLLLDPKGGKLITQFDMHAVEDAGLVKFDFLGIKNLAILADAVKRVKKIRNIKIDLAEIPVDNKKTFEMLARGETIGVFQLSGGGMTKYLKDLRPTTIHDINAMVALYRPGPMESIPDYIKRKYNKHLVEYLDPRMKTILDQSFGVITYQDDVMMIAIELGGYSWLEADKLRKAMGKKIPAEMEIQKKKLFAGLVENGMSPEKTKKLWSLIEPFAAYGFNKAHAASYGKVAYQTAYMKANFPAIYMSAVLTADSGDSERIAEAIGECKRMGIPVLPPDINESYEPFSVTEKDSSVDGDRDKIRFGLVTIKNFGQHIAEVIVEDRKVNGKFTSIQNFLDRIIDRNLNRKSLESLIKAGAFDSLEDRGQLLGNLDNLLGYNKEGGSVNDSQDSLFGLMTDKSTVPGLRMEDYPPIESLQALAWEKELLGLYISGNPLDSFKEKLKGKPTVAYIKKTSQEKKKVMFAGIVEEVKEIFTKKGDKMAFVKISDKSGSMETVMFPKIYEEYGEIVNNAVCVVIAGTFSKRNDESSVLIDKMKSLNIE
jgi:DNA polymerase III subunit alpha